MSKLFDDASLAMIPSAYKDGKLYSIRPVPEYGAEEVTNGDFATDTDWTKSPSGVTISGGAANFTSGQDTYVYQNIMVIGKQYRISLEYNVSSISTGYFGSNGGSGDAIISISSLNGTGILSGIITASDSKLIIRTSTLDGSIDNVSMKEVLVSDGDFTFSRGSNLAATRVDVNGLIEKGRENQILHSNAITTSPWGGPRIFSETQGHTGYDGSNNAWLIIPTTDNNTHYKVQSVSTTSGVNTISVYAKAGGYNYMTIRDDSGGSSYAKFDLANGLTESSGSNVITSKIESVGNGWYRCSLTYLETGTGNVLFYINETYSLSSVYTGDEVSGVYFQDFQVEQGLVATDYIETGASTAQAGILEDMPRLDYSGGASCPSLKLEPQRSNLITHSEYLANYPVNRGSVSSNAATSPEGVQNASELVPTAVDGDHSIQSTNSLSATTYTISCFAKNNGNDISLTLAYNSSNWTGCIFDLVNGEAKTPQQRGSQSVCTANIEPYGDGWYRCSITATLWTAYAGWLTFVSLVNDADGSLESSWGRQSFVGVPSETAYLYGFQLEQGSYPTSYIPCMGTSQTRSADSCAATSVSDIINQNEGTLFVDFVWNGKQDNIDYFLMAIIDSYGQNEIRLGGYNLALYGRVYSGGTLTFAQNYTTGAAKGQRYKVIIKYGSEGVKTFANGQLKDSGTPTLPTGTMYEIRITRSGVGTHSSINQSVYFPTALTDSECIALTTI